MKAIDTTKYRGAVKYRGVPFEWGDTFLIVPPLTCKQAEELSGELDKDISLVSPSAVATNEDWKIYRRSVREKKSAWKMVGLAALQRNYELTTEEIDDFFTEGNILDVYRAALGMTAETVKRIKSPEELAPADLGQK